MDDMPTDQISVLIDQTTLADCELGDKIAFVEDCNVCDRANSDVLNIPEDTVVQIIEVSGERISLLFTNTSIGDFEIILPRSADIPIVTVH